MEQENTAAGAGGIDLSTRVSRGKINLSSIEKLTAAMLITSRGLDTRKDKFLMHDYSSLPLFSLQPETKEIPLTQGKVAIVDASDYDWLMQFKWHAQKKSDKWYAGRAQGRNISFLMHREILDAPQGWLVDHKDGNGLNNTRNNIRLCTYAQNNFNTASYKGGSLYKGVHRFKRGWRAQIRKGGKQYSLGVYSTEEAAARAYDAAAKKMHGEFAYLNFPEDV